MDWKSKYESAWAASADREVRLSRALSAELGVELLPCGIGAGRTDRVEGYAADHGGRRGGADYKSACGRLLVEITGPNRPVSLSAALWLRPDKLSAAQAAHDEGQVTVILHETPRHEGTPVVRMIMLDAAGLDRRREWPTVSPSFRGSQESFAEIGATDPVVMNWVAGVQRLKAIVCVGAAKAPRIVGTPIRSSPFPSSRPASLRRPILSAPRFIARSPFASSRPRFVVGAALA